MMKFLLIILLIYVNADCKDVIADCKDTCGNSDTHICTGENTFAMCPDSTKILSCPAQNVCVESDNICERNGVPTCPSNCGKCDPTNKIACINETTYAFCFGGNEPHFETTVTCDKRMFCNSKEKPFCFKDKKPSCDDSNNIIPSTPTTPTTSSTPVEITLFCNKIRQGGKFAPAGDITCKKYNYCFMSRGQIMGRQYTCPGDTVFNCATQQCSNQCISNCMYPGYYPSTGYP